MRRRRDPFARVTYVPVRVIGPNCVECGETRRVYHINVESDDGRDNRLKGAFCSWTCAEQYHGTRIAR